MNKNIIVVGILVLLVLVSIVQTFQVLGIKDNINDIDVTGKSSPSILSGLRTSNNSPSNSVPTNLQNLPGMVGGC